MAGVYKTLHFTSCFQCGHLCRIEVEMPVPGLSDKRMVKFCPMCGAEWHYEDGYGNGTGFKLLSRWAFGREPTESEVAIVASIYPEWDATLFPNFKDFLKALVAAG